MTPPTIDSNDQVTGGNVVVINYNDGTQHAENIPWTVTWEGGNTSGSILSNNESALVTVDLTKIQLGTTTGSGSNATTTYAAITAPGAYAQFTIQIVPPTGAAITITRSLPGSLSPVMDLH
jgi:archaellin